MVFRNEASGQWLGPLTIRVKAPWFNPCDFVRGSGTRCRHREAPLFLGLSSKKASTRQGLRHFIIVMKSYVTLESADWEDGWVTLGNTAKCSQHTSHTSSSSSVTSETSDMQARWLLQDKQPQLVQEGHSYWPALNSGAMLPLSVTDGQSENSVIVRSTKCWKGSQHCVTVSIL
jgi:hypothetical protein